MKIIIITDASIDILKERVKSALGIFIESSKVLPSVQENFDQIIIDTRQSETVRRKVDILKKSTFYPIHRVDDESISNENLLHFIQRVGKDVSIHTRIYNFFDETPLPTKYGDFFEFGFRGRIHGREVIGLRTPHLSDNPYVRIHSMCHTGDIFGSLKCDCGDELQNALEFIAKSKDGMLIYTPEEGRDIGVLNKIKVYKSQIEGYDTVDAQYVNHYPNDLRNYDYIKDIFEHFNLRKTRLISNNPEKKLQFEIAGVEVAEVVKLASSVNPHNEHYLRTKMTKNGHDFSLEFNT